MLSALLDPSQVLALSVDERTANLEGEQIDVAADRVERRSQLVRHRREKERLRSIRFLGARRSFLRGRARLLRELGLPLQFLHRARELLRLHLELGRLLLQMNVLRFELTGLLSKVLLLSLHLHGL